MQPARISNSVAARREKTGIPRLYKYIGKRAVSFQYFHRDRRTETLASAPSHDRLAIADALRMARRKAVDIEQGAIIGGSVAEVIDRFKDEIDPTHYRDQSKDGRAVRELRYNQLKYTFGKMRPADLKMFHGYQHMDRRAKEGAPVGANKEMASMQTICHYCVRWGILSSNPFVGLMQNKTEKSVRIVTRHQVVGFYLWALKQPLHFRTMGCAAIFAYLTGFRAAEVRPFHLSGIVSEGVQVTSAKRKKGERAIVKIREWSMKLRAVVARAQQGRKVASLYLFANRSGQPYSKSGWGSVWQDAMAAWGGEYFTLNDGRPTAITKKIERRDVDVYDFAAHSNPSTTHKYYDRRRVKRAAATE